MVETMIRRLASLAYLPRLRKAREEAHRALQDAKDRRNTQDQGKAADRLRTATLRVQAAEQGRRW
jgi:hypothetical protein